jgi:hypothetical protein
MQLYAETRSQEALCLVQANQEIGEICRGSAGLDSRVLFLYMFTISLMLTSGGNMHTAGILVTTAAAYTVLLWQHSGVKKTPLRTLNSHEAAQPGVILACLSGTAALRLQCDGYYQQSYMLMLCCSVLT